MSTIMNSLNAEAMRDPRLETHPDRARGGTKYISIFRNRRGDAIALELSSGSKSGIFVAARLTRNSVLPAIDRVRYA